MFTINMEECDQITSIYERQAEQCVRAVTRFYGEIDGLARKTCYEPLVRFCNAIYAYYMGDLRTHLMTQFQYWYDGPYSFHALMQAIDAGDSAVQNARSKMDNMQRSLESMFRSVGGEVHVDTTIPKIKKQDFEEYREYLTTCERAFDDAMRNAQSAIRGMEGGNDVVKLIGDIVLTTGESLKTSFLEMVKQVTEGEEFADMGSGRVISSVTDTAQTADVHVPWVKGSMVI